MQKSDLVNFEQEILKLFEQKQIKAPIHLDNGNEDQLISFFETFIRPQDWICCSWRSHYKCLLKGVPPELIRQKILRGRSISLCFKDYNVISSAIVGGIVPIALGIAMGLKKQGSDKRVFCFIGEMTAFTGAVWESYVYAKNHGLNLWFIIEDNEHSVCTPTYKVWNNKEEYPPLLDDKDHRNIYYFKYKSEFPHSGGKKRVNF